MSGPTPVLAVRRSEESDEPGIVACLRAAFEPYRTSYTAGAFADTVPDLEGIRARRATMDVVVAVTADGTVVGTVAFRPTGGREGHVRGMAVLPEYVGTGVARTLLEFAEEELARAGCSVVTLDTTAPLERAIRFYERSGYRRSGRAVDFFGMPLYEYVKRRTTR